MIFTLRKLSHDILEVMYTKHNFSINLISPSTFFLKILMNVLRSINMWSIYDLYHSIQFQISTNTKNWENCTEISITPFSFGKICPFVTGIWCSLSKIYKWSLIKFYAYICTLSVHIKVNSKKKHYYRTPFWGEYSQFEMGPVNRNQKHLLKFGSIPAYFHIFYCDTKRIYRHTGKPIFCKIVYLDI